MKTLRYTFILMLMISLVACNKGKGTEIKGEAKAKVLAYAEPMSENLLVGFSAGDHAVYSRDFNAKLKNGIPDNVFQETRTMITEKLGAYKSRKLQKVMKEGTYTSVYYTGEFEKDQKVTIQVVFVTIGGKNLIGGLWFKSPKMAK